MVMAIAFMDVLSIKKFYEDAEMTEFFWTQQKKQLDNVLVITWSLFVYLIYRIFSWGFCGLNRGQIKI